MPYAARALGFAAGLTKAAAAVRTGTVVVDGIRDQVLADLREISGDATVTAQSRLDDVLPKGTMLEALIASQEHNFNVHLSDAVLARLFASGTAEDLARALSAASMAAVPVKTASASPQQRQHAHQRYLQRRPMMLAASKAYRMQHMSQIRRRARSYRRSVKRKIHRPKKRIGTAGGGFSFIPR